MQMQSENSTLVKSGLLPPIISVTQFDRIEYWLVYVGGTVYRVYPSSFAKPLDIKFPY